MLNKTMFRLLRNQQCHTIVPMTSTFNMMPTMNLLGDMQTRQFALKKSTRINRRLRKYRADKIQRESSYYALQERK